MLAPKKMSPWSLEYGPYMTDGKITHIVGRIGTATIVDEISQQSHKLKQGSLVWIPKGSKASFSSSKDFYTVYVEQCHGQSGFKTGFEPVAKKSLKPQLDSLVATFASENPASLERHKRSQNTLAGGNTRAVLHEEPFPLAIESGYGPYVVSVDKRKYLDLVSDYSAGLFGHSNAVIADAVSRAVSNGFNLGGVTKVEVELGERIKQRFDGIEKIRFCNSGTEANTYALATAMTFTGRKKILVFDNGYHGGTLSFSSRGNPLNLPHDFVFGKYNNIEETRRLISSELAAIIVEPMLAAGGQIAATRDFLLFLREAANVTGAVLIFDEVVTSRLHVNGLQGFHNIKPDMTTLGKYLGGGLPFGAFGGRSDIMALFDPSRQKLSHSGTFNNNAFTMYAALAASDLVTEKEINRINKFGDTIREEVATKIQEGFGKAPEQGNVDVEHCIVIGKTYLDGYVGWAVKYPPKDTDIRTP
ncbi:hypothetical protein EsH8_VI_001083 [Colletotrichum jinshuiense]